MLVVAALGGNALLRRGEPADAETQRRNIEVAADALAQLAEHHQVVVTHGNGPQVGLLALQAEAYRDVAPYPLDVLGAESEGMIGYLLEQSLLNRLPATPTATLLTQVVVDEHDPAFQHPSKPVGPTYDRDTAQRLAKTRHWTVAPDGEQWRRVVASPEPQRIVELQTIKTLVNAGVLVVCVGGGGIPVRLDSHQALHGVEAVIDKDRAAALLARELGADALLLLTDVPQVERFHGTDHAQSIRQASARQLDLAELDAGSMRPKVEAACRFAAETRGIAAIGALADAPAILAGQAGTRIVPEPVEVVKLRDGSSITIRPNGPDDEPALRVFLSRMCLETRRLRFFTGAADVTSAAHLSAAADTRHYGLIAHDGLGAVIGHALYIQLDPTTVQLDPTTAEVAVEVADHLHGRGLGTLLISRLAATAESHGITRFVAEVLPDNHAMLDVFRDGFHASMRFHDGVEVVEFPTSAWRTAPRLGEQPSPPPVTAGG